MNAERPLGFPEENDGACGRFEACDVHEASEVHGVGHCVRAHVSLVFSGDFRGP